MATEDANGDACPVPEPVEPTYCTAEDIDAGDFQDAEGAWCPGYDYCGADDNGSGQDALGEDCEGYAIKVFAETYRQLILDYIATHRYSDGSLPGEKLSKSYTGSYEFIPGQAAPASEDAAQDENGDSNQEQAEADSDEQNNSDNSTNNEDNENNDGGEGDDNEMSSDEQQNNGEDNEQAATGTGLYSNILPRWVRTHF